MACSFLRGGFAFSGSVLSPGPLHLGQKLGLAECKVNTRGILPRCWEAGVTTPTSISSSSQAGRGHSTNNHGFNASTREAGAGRAPWVWGQFRGYLVRPVSYCAPHSSPRNCSLQHVKTITEKHKPPQCRTGEPHPTDTSPIEILDIRLRNHCTKVGRKI